MRCVVGALRPFSDRRVVAASRYLGAFMGKLGSCYGDRAVINMKATLGVDEEQARDIARQAFHTMALGFLGLCVLDHRLDVDRDVDIEGLEHLVAARESGRPVIVCSGHFGAWHVLPAVIDRHVRKPWFLVRVGRNPKIHDYLHECHGQNLVGLIPKHLAGTAMVRRMHERACIIGLFDQHAGRTAATVDFLGHPAQQHTAPARLAVRYGAVVLPVYAWQLGETRRCRVVVEAPLEPRPDLPPQEASLDITQRLSASLETRVIAEPGLWNWIHDRWHGRIVKGKSPGKGVGARALQHSAVATTR